VTDTQGSSVKKETESSEEGSEGHDTPKGVKKPRQAGQRGTGSKPEEGLRETVGGIHGEQTQ